MEVASVLAMDFKEKNMKQVYVEDGYCGSTKAAKALMVSIGTVHKLVERGELVAWRTEGGHRRIDVQSQRNYLMRRGRLLATANGDAPQLLMFVVTKDEHTKIQLKLNSKEWGTRVKTVLNQDLIQAMLALNDANPQVVLLDARLLGSVGGFEALKSLRGHAGLRNLSILVMCSADERTVELSALALTHKIQLLDKPLDMGWLVGYVNALLFNRDLMVTNTA